MENTMDKLDRATMTTWRASNYAVWTAIAVGAALVFHQVVDRFTSGAIFPTWSNVGAIDVRPSASFGGTGWFWAPRYSVYAATSILAGLLIATIVAKKVAGRRVAIASVAAGAYVLIVWLLLQSSLAVTAPQTHNGILTYPRPAHGLPRGAEEWGYAAFGLLAVLSAWLWARFLVNRKERRLSPETRG